MTNYWVSELATLSLFRTSWSALACLETVCSVRPCNDADCADGKFSSSEPLSDFCDAVSVWREAVAASCFVVCVCSAELFFWEVCFWLPARSLVDGFSKDCSLRKFSFCMWECSFLSRSYNKIMKIYSLIIWCGQQVSTRNFILCFRSASKRMRLFQR